MSLTTFLRHAIRSVARNRRRTLSSILGIVLAITMVAGVNIALDSTTNNILRGLLDQVPYDFVAIGYNSDWKNATVALESASRVHEVEPVIDAGVAEIVTWDENGNYTMTGYGSVKGVQPTFQKHMEDFDLDGIIPVENGTVVLPEDIHYWDWQPETKPKVGDVVGLVYYRWDGSGNITSIFFNFTVVGFVQYNPDASSFWWGGEFYNSVFLTIHDAETIRDTMQGSEYIYIWADRDKLIVPFSSEATKTNIVRMQRTLQMTVSPYNVDVETGGLINAINSFNLQIFFLRILFIALSLPALVLAIYLGSVGIEMGMEERRREVSIIKARGADTGHITGLFVLEAIISGTIAGILGLLLGVIASRFLLGVMVGGLGAPIDLAMFNISWETVFVAIILAIIFMGVASIRPIRHASKMTVTEGLHRYSDVQAKLVYKPTWDFIMLTLALVTFGLAFYLMGQRGGDPYQYSALMCIIGPILMVLIPVSPVFLILSITRLLTRGTSKVYGWASRLVKPIAKDLTNMVKMNLLRNPKRASRICLLVALGLAFGILASTMAESQLAYDERLLRTEIGADIKVDVSGTNITFREDLASIPGVREVVPVFTIMGRTEGNFIVFNASAYMNAVSVDDYYFTKGESESLELLTDNGYAIISQTYAETAYYDIGDTIRLAIDTRDGPYVNTTFYNLIIVAVVKALPGLQAGSQYYFPGDPYGGYIYLDFSSIPVADFVNMNVSNIMPDQRYLIDVSDEDAGVVAQRIEEAFPWVRIKVLEDEIIKARSDPLRGAVFHFLVIEIAFVILIMSFGLGLVMYTATLEREVELGNIRARGSSGRQLSQLMLGEAVSIVVIGAIIGIGTGLLSGVMFNGVLNFASTAGGSTAALDRPFVFGLQSLALVLIAFISLIIAAIVATYRVRSMDLSRVLRKRGG